MNKKPAWILMVVLVSMLSGCATNQTVYRSDPNGERTKIVYGPLASSDSMVLTDGAEFRISVVVYPVSDSTSPATLMVHFKNDSQNTHEINLLKIRVRFGDHAPGAEYPLGQKFLLREGMKFNSKSFKTVAPTVGEKFYVDLFYELNEKAMSQIFPMTREIISKETKYVSPTFPSSKRGPLADTPAPVGRIPGVRYLDSEGKET